MSRSNKFQERTIMDKKYHTLSEGAYQAPQIDVTEVTSEGVLCGSMQHAGFDGVEELEW